MAKKSDLVIVSRVQSEAVAHIIKSHLESEGMPVLLQYESMSKVFGLTVDGLGEVRILVPKELAEEAKRIIEPEPV